MTRKNPAEQPPPPSPWRQAGGALAIPTLLAACVLVGVVGGRLADHWFDSRPAGTLIGLVLGALAGIRETFRIVRKMNSASGGAEKREGRGKNDYGNGNGAAGPRSAAPPGKG